MLMTTKDDEGKKASVSRLQPAPSKVRGFKPSRGPAKVINFELRRLARAKLLKDRWRKC